MKKYHRPSIEKIDKKEKKGAVKRIKTAFFWFTLRDYGSKQ